ncbi:MAG: PD40 domain-containing protein [Actinobacteria bacterium]|nr:PD40 domain-containing protein [Actinomycetota bacterium]
MRAITTILVILLLIASLFFLLSIAKIVKKVSSDIEPSTEISNQEETTIPTEEVEETSSQVEESSEDIAKIEIYLDGTRENGIFLGEAEYGLYSEKAKSIYGESFAQSGYRLLWENNQYIFEPGSIHYLYIYTFIPEHGWDYIREEIKIPGELNTQENIKLYVDGPKPDATVSGDIRISGWAGNISTPENPGINKVEIYLDGPKNFGKFLGEAEYGLERPDVAKVLNNENFTNTGYSFVYNVSGLEPGTTHSFYVYAYSTTGEYQLVVREVKIEGEQKETKSIISVETNLRENYNTSKIEIGGWAISRKRLEGGITLPLDIEYSIKKIVFTSTKNGNEDIFSINIDGTELTQLTDHPGNDMYPSVSPDGKKIAYTSDIDGIWQIVVMDWDGKNKRQITKNPWRSGFPSWSFDGKFIYFEGYIDGSWEIFRINSDGSNMKQLTFNPNADDWHPCGHPYEYKIIYESGTPGNEDLYIMDHDGKNIKRISDEKMRKRVPAISIDGKVIVFSDNDSLYTMDINGENIKKISGSLKNCRHSDISPDNKYVTFEANIDNQMGIFIVNLDGSNLTKLTNIPENSYDPYFLYQAP